MQPKRPSLTVIIEMLIIVIAVFVMVVSMIPGLPWATYEREGSIGPIGYNLDGEFDAVGFEYSLETVESEGGGLIDMGGGFGANFSISKRKAYPEVRGEFLDNIGILYNSYRTKEFEYELKMRSPPQGSGIIWEKVGNPAVTLNVTLESDLIPWWPETGKRDLDVKIEMKEADLWEQVGETERSTLSIQVDKITIMAKVGYDTETGEYTGEDVALAEKEKTMMFNGIGDTKTVGFSIGYPSGTEAAGLYVVVQGNMTDYWGRDELSPLSGKPNPINIFPMSTGKIIQGVGIPLALPLMIISSLLGFAAVIITVFRDKLMIPLMAPAAALSLIAPLWFLIGMKAAVALIGERLVGAEAGLSWGPGIFISFTGAFLMIGALTMSIVFTYMIKKENDDNKEEGGSTSFKRVEKASGTGDASPVFKKI